MTWEVETPNRVLKQIEKLPDLPKISFFALLKELQEDGPYRNNWKHYGKLKGLGDQFHCHILSGRPTYVACWEISNKKLKIIGVYYVGTHENAPY